MDELNGPVLVVIALVLVIGITAAITVNLPGNDLPDGLSDDDEQVEIDNFIRTDDEEIVRQPTRGDFDFEDGDPPSAVNEFEPFEEVSTEIGFEYESTFRGTGILSRSGVYVVDYNNNGYEDILATGGSSPVLFENTGDGYRPARVFEHPDTRAAHFFDSNNNGYPTSSLLNMAGSWSSTPMRMGPSSNEGSASLRAFGAQPQLPAPISREMVVSTCSWYRTVSGNKANRWKHAMPERFGSIIPRCALSQRAGERTCCFTVTANSSRR